MWSRLRGPAAAYEYEPDLREILDEIIPRFTALQVYQAILEFQASEHAARMVAMHNATDNAKELAGAYELEYNKMRQQTITNDILDIVGGAEALAKLTIWRYESWQTATGRVVQILGGVVDVEFPEGAIPELFEAIEVERPGQEPLILEVQKHLGDNWVRTVAMDCHGRLAARRMRRVAPARRSWCRSARPHWVAFSMCSASPWTRKARSRRLSIIPSIALRRSSQSNPPVSRCSKPASRSLT